PPAQARQRPQLPGLPGDPQVGAPGIEPRGEPELANPAARGGHAHDLRIPPTGSVVAKAIWVPSGEKPAWSTWATGPGRRWGSEPITACRWLPSSRSTYRRWMPLSGAPDR